MICIAGLKNAVTTAPSVEPVTLADAKIHLRTVTGDTSEDSAVISPIITAARVYCENITGRALAAQTVKAYPEAWGLWRLPRPPITAVTSIKYYDVDDTEYTLAATEYQSDMIDGRILIKENPDEELRDMNPIVVEYTAGYTTGNTCPQTIRQAMLLLIAHWYQNREAVITGSVSAEVDIGVRRLLNQYKAWWM